MSRRTLGIVLALLAGGAVLFFWPKKPLDDEAQIRALFAACVQAAEDRKLDVISEAMAPEFKAHGANKDEVRQMLAFQLLRDKETTAVLNPSLDVTLELPNASVSSELVFARTKPKSAAEVAPQSVVAAYHLDAKLEKRDGKWLFVSAEYRQR